MGYCGTSKPAAEAMAPPDSVLDDKRATESVDKASVKRADMDPRDPGANAVGVFGDRTSAILGLNRAGLISDEEAERALFGGGRFEDEIELDYPVSLDLYEDDNPYEVAYHRAYIHEDAIEVDEVTVEKGPYDRYGLRHKVEGPGFAAFKEALGADGPGLVEAVRTRFSGADGIHRFDDFCKAHGIEKTMYLIR